MKKKVLLIEDDKTVRENTSEILELANYTVKTAKNGKEGVALAKSFLPDIIICDILMPLLDGYGVLQIISKSPLLEHIPFIFLTAKTTHDDLRKGMELGADDYISKPFGESELLRAIESRLKRVKILEQNSKPIEFKNVSGCLNIKNIDQFLATKKVFTFNKGETIYCEGNLSNHIFLIKKGMVKTYKINEYGKELNTGFYSSNQYFGFSSFLKNTPHFENSKAMSFTKLYKINRAEIASIIKNNNHILYDLVIHLAGNSVELKNKLMLFAYGSVRKKTAVILLNLHESFTEVVDNEIFITRLNLANSIGIAKETLARTLHDFKEEKLIDISTKSIKILNKMKLSKVD
ncbi:response regulator [Lutibacter holmesii]|uniref:Response regulator n=1 Tax=Lutibacter holmesii TaxID=1137985 RepID=A0ABW3WNE4_9FLAO